MASLLAMIAFLCVGLNRIDRWSCCPLRWRGRVLSPHRLFGISQTVSDRGRIDRIFVILDGIHDQDVFRSDLCQQHRNVCSIANRSGRDGIQSMYEQSYTINEFARTAAALASGFAKLGEQLAESGEFHPPVSFFEFIPEVARRLESRDMNDDIGGQ